MFRNSRHLSKLLRYSKYVNMKTRQPYSTTQNNKQSPATLEHITAMKISDKQKLIEDANENYDFNVKIIKWGLGISICSFGAVCLSPDYDNVLFTMIGIFSGYLTSGIGIGNSFVKETKTNAEAELDYLKQVEQRLSSQADKVWTTGQNIVD